MPETEIILLNGNPVIIEKVITSGELLVSALMTVLISLVLSMIILYIIKGGR